jgi:hypothetical protein
MASVFQVYRSIAQTKVIALTELGRVIERKKRESIIVFKFKFNYMKTFLSTVQTIVVTSPAASSSLMMLKMLLQKKRIILRMKTLLAICIMATAQYTS